MIIILISICIVLELAVGALIFILYKKLNTSAIDRNAEILTRIGTAVAASPEKKETPQSPDDKASNAERLYMEGIQNVLSFDYETMISHLKGVSEE